MRQIDMHGKRLKEAEDLFYEILNETRLKKRDQEVLFITGSGAIRDVLQRLAAEQDLNSYVPMSNRGCLVVEFE